MFYLAPFNGDISKWNTSKVKLMTGMFEKSVFVGDISNWNTTRVENFDRMFLNAEFAGDISKWTFTPFLGVDTLSHMFSGDLRSVDTLSHMFSEVQLKKLEAPNMYCWAYAIAAPNHLLLRPEWQQHLNTMLAPLLGLGLPILDSAVLAHQAWQGRHLSRDSIPLPALD